MKPIFPKYAFGSVNLPVWQNNVIRFLSNHRKYRVLWWEFGPTLLDYLHRVKEGQSPDYTKNGLVLTYSIASIVALASFASTCRAAFTAAATSGIVLLGIATTVAIDYQKTKRKDNSEVTSQEYCLGLLEVLGNTPQYWWWPWSRKIKDITVTERQKDRAVNYNDYSFVSRLFYSLFTNVISHQFCVARYGYLYNYHKLGGEMPFGVNINLFRSAKQPGRDKANIENKLEIKPNNLIRRILNIGNEPTLGAALSSLQFGWLLSHLDESLKGVQVGSKTKEEHDQYFNNLIKDVRKLSLMHHSDKKTNKQGDADAEQKLINETMKTLRNVHKQVMEKHNNTYNEYYGVYRLYGELSMNILNSGKDILSVVNVSPFDGRSVLLHSLGMLSYYEEGRLLSRRNEYIKEAKEIVKCYQDILELLRKCKDKDIYIFAKKKKEEFDQRRNSEWHRYLIDWVHEVNIDLEADKGLEVIKKVIDAQEKAFNQYEKDYLRSYNDYWVKPLEVLSKNCQEDKELEVIKKEVEELYNESKKQQEILIGKGNGVANDLFVQPILSYRTLVKAYHKFVMGLHDDIVKKNKVYYGDLQYALSETGLDSKFVKESKGGVEKLSETELLDFLNGMVNNYYPNGFLAIKPLGRQKVKEMMNCFASEDGGNTEMIHLIMFMLNNLEKRFDDKFKKQETYFDRREKKERESKVRSEELKKMLEEAEQRAEQIKIIGEVFTKRMIKLNDKELRDVVTDSHSKIVEEIVGHVMKRNSSQEQVLDAIIEEVMSNRDQVMREGAVGDELINKVLEEMNETEVDLSTFFQDVDVSQGATAKIQK